MATFNVSIEGKTYHVDIPWLGARPLPMIVNGQTFELCLGNGDGVMPAEMSPSGKPVIMTMPTRPVMAQWHANIREE